MPYLGEVVMMSKFEARTNAVWLWYLRHNLGRVLRGKKWRRLKNVPDGFQIMKQHREVMLRREDGGDYG